VGGTGCGNIIFCGTCLPPQTCGGVCGGDSGAGAAGGAPSSSSTVEALPAHATDARAINGAAHEAAVRVLLAAIEAEPRLAPLLPRIERERLVPHASAA
jgi:hypothetical protein